MVLAEASSPVSGRPAASKKAAATATANTLVYAPNVIGLATGAALVELTGHRLVLVALGGALLVTAAPLFRRPTVTERTAPRSRQDAGPA